MSPDLQRGDLEAQRGIWLRRMDAAKGEFDQATTVGQRKCQGKFGWSLQAVLSFGEGDQTEEAAKLMLEHPK